MGPRRWARAPEREVPRKEKEKGPPRASEF